MTGFAPGAQMPQQSVGMHNNLNEASILSQQQSQSFNDLFSMDSHMKTQANGNNQNPSGSQNWQSQSSAPIQNTVSPTSVPVITKESKAEHIIFHKNGLQIKLSLPSPSSASHLLGSLVFSNITPVIFTNLNFMVSVPKSMTLQLESLSSTVLQPFNQFPATQKFQISNPSKENLRMRFKVEYNMNG